MKRLSMYAFTIVVACTGIGMLATVALHRSLVVAGNVTNDTDATFRDGLFLGRLDAGQDRKPHLASGRWNTDADRRLFVSAYLQAYREMQRSAASEEIGSSQIAAQRGYHDGITDGLQQNYGSKPFKASATENYQSADRGYSESSGDLNQYKQVYREAYCNGYQQGYYGETAKIKTAEFSRVSGPNEE